MPGPRSLPPAEGYGRVLGNLVTLGATLIGIGLVQSARSTPKAEPAPVALEPQVSPPPRPKPQPVKVPPPPAPLPPTPILDRVAVGRAEEAVEAARRERARSEERLATAQAAATSAAAKASQRILEARTLPSRLRDPTARITRATSRLASLEGEKARLQKEIAALAQTPRPKGKPLIDKSPVARPADGEEFHFELRHERVTPIDLERLLGQVKVDARIQLRRTEGRSGSLFGHVGPVGAFSMTYQLGRTGDPFDIMGASFGLQAWEIVPDAELRGETYEVAVRPISDFSRAIARLNHERATITLWAYSDSFVLYRKLRDLLHAQGFQVAARPMPEGMPIRGSLAGTVSAGQ